MEKCPLCKSEKTAGVTTYSVDLGFGVVVVRGVPAKICSQCAEEWIEADTAKELEKIVAKAKKNHCQLEVLSFPLALV